MFCCTFRNTILLFFFSTAIALASAVNCPSADDNGTPLTGSSSSGDTITCTYQGAGACTYFPINGSFSSGSSTCPKGEPQVVPSDPETTSADPPPAITAPDSTMTQQTPTGPIVPPLTTSTIPHPPPPPSMTSSAPTITVAPPPPPPPTIASHTTAVSSTTSIIVVTRTSSVTTTSTANLSATPTNNAAAHFLTDSYCQSAVAFAVGVLAMNLF